MPSLRECPLGHAAPHQEVIWPVGAKDPQRSNVMARMKKQLQIEQGEEDLSADEDLFGLLTEREEARQKRIAINNDLEDYDSQLLVRFPESTNGAGKTYRCQEFQIKPGMVGGMERKASLTEPHYRVKVKRSKGRLET